MLSHRYWLCFEARHVGLHGMDVTFSLEKSLCWRL